VVFDGLDAVESGDEVAPGVAARISAMRSTSNASTVIETYTWESRDRFSGGFRLGLPAPPQDVSFES